MPGSPQQNVGWTERAQHNAEVIRDLLEMPNITAGRGAYRSKVVWAALQDWTNELLGKDERSPMDIHSIKALLQQYVEDNWTDSKQNLKPVNLYMRPEIMEAVNLIGDWLATMPGIPFLHSRSSDNGSGFKGYNVTMIIQVALEKYRGWLELTHG